MKNVEDVEDAVIDELADEAMFEEELMDSIDELKEEDEKALEAKVTRATELKQDFTLIRSTDNKFVKDRDIIVNKGHLFTIQSVSPKKIILKLMRKLPKETSWVDGVFCYVDKENKFVRHKDVLTPKGKRRS